jgi:hypothetical protein
MRLVTPLDGGDRRREKGIEQMKYSRAAAVVAGSFVAMGAATPAFAADATAMPPMSLDAGVADAVSSVTQMDDLTKADPTVGGLTDTVTDLNNVRGNVPEEVLKTTGASTPMLGGISLGG